MPFLFRYLFSFCFLFLILYSTGKESSPALLRKKLKSENYSSSDKAYFADTLLNFYRSSKPDSSLLFIRLMIHHAKKANDNETIDYGYTNLGSIFRVLGKYDSSVIYYKKALLRYRDRKFEDGIASIYSNLANVYKLQSRYDLAIKNYLEAIDVFKHSKNRNALANAYSGLAGLYFKLDNIDKAFEYWGIAEKEYAQGEHKNHISHAYRGKTRVFLKKNEFEKARIELQKAFMNDSIFPNDIYMAENLLLKMEWLLNKKVWENSDVFIKTSSRLRKNSEFLTMPLTSMRYYELMGDYYSHDSEKSLIYYDSSLAVILDKEDDTPEIKLNLLRKKFKLQLSNSSASNLLIPYNILTQFEKNVAKIKNERIAQETDARYSLKDKEEKIKILDEKNKTANELIEREKELWEQAQTQNLLLWSGIGLFLIFIIYILFINRKLNSTQKELQKNIEQKDFLFRELNHRVKNNLHIVSSFLSIESHGKPDEVKEILLTCENRIHSLGLVHEMLYKGEISENIEVNSYFEKLIQVIRETLLRDDIEIISEFEKDVVLTSNKIVLLGLIANELITNSIKYGKAKNKKTIIRISVKKQESWIRLVVSDNGSGLDESKIKNSSLGMRLAKGLALQLDGTFSHENKDEGVEFTVVF